MIKKSFVDESGTVWQVDLAENAGNKVVRIHAKGRQPIDLDIDTAEEFAAEIQTVMGKTVMSKEK